LFTFPSLSSFWYPLTAYSTVSRERPSDCSPRCSYNTELTEAAIEAFITAGSACVSTWATGTALCAFYEPTAKATTTREKDIIMMGKKMVFFMCKWVFQLCGGQISEKYTREKIYRANYRKTLRTA
jgi:hypothetical protein